MECEDQPLEIRFGSASVTLLDPELKCVTFRVDCKDNEVDSCDQLKDKAMQLTKRCFMYLLNEGFIKDQYGWTINVVIEI
jgi:hypothetical protein